MIDSGFAMMLIIMNFRNDICVNPVIMTMTSAGEIGEAMQKMKNRS